MAIKTSTELKAYFETGDIPTQQQFIDLIDSTYKGYDSYAVLLNQSGTSAPTAIINQNTLGVTFSWSYISVSVYKLTLPFDYDTTKHHIFFGIGDTANNGAFSVSKELAASNELIFTFKETDSGTPSATNGLLVDTAFEFRIYN